MREARRGDPVGSPPCNVRVGQYGGFFEGSHASVVINSKFTGQSAQAIVYADRGALMLVGVEISGGKGILMEAASTSPWVGNLDVIDSKIDVTSGPAISGNRSLFLKNTWLKNASGNLISLTDPVSGLTPLTEGVSTAWKLYPEWAGGVNINQYPAGSNVGRVGVWAPAGAKILDSAHPYKVATSGGTPPADFSQGTGNFHAWPADFNSLPLIGTDSGTTINAKTTTLVGLSSRLDTGATNNGTRLNAIIAAAPANSKIFIPSGTYVIDVPVVLNKTVTLYGVGSGYSTLKAQSGMGANAMIVGNSGFSPKLADLRLLLPTHIGEGTYFISWQSGASSGAKSLALDRRASDLPDGNLNGPSVLITGAGGGRWYGLWLDGQKAQGTAFRHIKVWNTTADLRFYMLNPEHATQSPQAEFDNADNFRIYQLKAESGPSGDKETASFLNCNNFRVFGHAGTSSPATGAHANIRLLTGNLDYLFSQIQFQQQGSPSPTAYERLIDNGTPKVHGVDQAVLYKRGDTTTTPR